MSTPSDEENKCSNSQWNDLHVDVYVTDGGSLVLGLTRFISFVIIFALYKYNRRRSDYYGGNSMAIAKGLVLPSYFAYIIAFISFNLLFAILDVVIRGLSADLHDEHLANTWLIPVEIGISHCFYEGLAFFLMQQGAGINAIHQAFWYGSLWGFVTTVVTFFIVAIVNHTYDFSTSDATDDDVVFIIFTTYQLVLLSFYSSFLVLPIDILFRRHAMVFYAKFNIFYQLFYLLSALVVYLELPDSVCATSILSVILVALVQPVAIFRTLQLDSEYWQGMSPANVGNPLASVWDHVDVQTASSMAENLDSFDHRAVKLPIIHFGQINFDSQMDFIAGGFSRVYFGKYKKQKVALKALFAMELAPSDVQEFYAEAAVLSALQHETIVRCLGICVIPPSLLLVLEFCKYGSLFDFLYKPRKLRNLLDSYRERIESMDERSPRNTYNTRSSGSYDRTSMTGGAAGGALSEAKRSRLRSSSSLLSEWLLSKEDLGITQRAQVHNNYNPETSLSLSLGRGVSMGMGVIDGLDSPNPSMSENSRRSKQIRWSLNPSNTLDSRGSNANAREVRAAIESGKYSVRNVPSSLIEPKEEIIVTSGSGEVVAANQGSSTEGNGDPGGGEAEQESMSARSSEAEVLKNVMEVARSFESESKTNVKVHLSSRDRDGSGDSAVGKQSPVIPPIQIQQGKIGEPEEDVMSPRMSAFSLSSSPDDKNDTDIENPIHHPVYANQAGLGGAGNASKGSAAGSGAWRGSPQAGDRKHRSKARFDENADDKHAQREKASKDSKDGKDSSQSHSQPSQSDTGSRRTRSLSTRVVESLSSLIYAAQGGAGTSMGGCGVGVEGNSKRSARFSARHLSRSTAKSKDTASALAAALAAHQRQQQEVSGNGGNGAAGSISGVEAERSSAGAGNSGALGSGGTAAGAGRPGGLSMSGLGGLNGSILGIDTSNIYLPLAYTTSYAHRLRMMDDAVQSIAFMHSKGYMHCDIKSLNFLVTEDLRVKLADMGEARPINCVPKRDIPPIPARNWAPPEVLAQDAKASSYTTKSDVYGLSLVLSELILLELPFGDLPERVNPTTWYQMLTEDHLRPKLPATTPAALRKVIEQGWVMYPGLRPSAEHMHDVLRELLLEIGQQTDSHSLPSRTTYV